MTMISIELPDDVFALVRKSPSEVAKEFTLAAAMRWYEQGMASQEKAAHIAGVSRWGFLDALARERKEAFLADIDSIKRELEGA